MNVKWKKKRKEKKRNKAFLVMLQCAIGCGAQESKAPPTTVASTVHAPSMPEFTYIPIDK